MQFTSIASSSAGCSYILRSAELPALLIDCGVGIKDIQRALNYTVSDLAGCLVSHAHLDHAKSASHLLDRAVPVYASAETLTEIKLASHYLARHVIPGVSFSANGVLNPDSNGWNIKPFEVPHDCPGTLGFMIGDQCGDVLVYLTDAAYSPFKFYGMTHIAIECNHSREILHQNRASGDLRGERYRRTVGTHMSLERLVEMLQANDLSKLKEIHLLHLSDENSDEAVFKSAIQRVTGVPVHVAPKRSY